MSGDKPMSGSSDTPDVPPASRANVSTPADAAVAQPWLEVTLSLEDMQAHLESGRAQTLSRFVTDYVEHQSHWWLLAPDRWLRIDDADLEATLHGYRNRVKGGLFNVDP